MKKIAYVFGSIEIILGLLVLATISLVENTLPVLGRVAFQAAMKGGFSPSQYIVDFPGATTCAVVLIALGAVQIIFAFIAKNTRNQ